MTAGLAEPTVFDGSKTSAVQEYGRLEISTRGSTVCRENGNTELLARRNFEKRNVIGSHDEPLVYADLGEEL